MRLRLALIPALATFAAAQPAPTAEGPPVEPPPPAPPATVTVTPTAPGAMPTITINITNNNNSNNNSNSNSQSNNQNNNQTNTVSTPVTTTVTLAPPSAVAPVAVVAPTTVARHASSDRWLMLGATRDHNTMGARASIDVLSRGHFALGLDAAIAFAERDHAQVSGGAYLAWTAQLGRFDLRAQVGAEVGPGGHEHHHHHRDLDVRGEAAVLLGLPLGHNLGIVAGPIVTADDPKHLDVTMFAGLRYRL